MFPLEFFFLLGLFLVGFLEEIFEGDMLGDMGITLRVTVISLSCMAQLEAHEDTRWQAGPLRRCGRRFLEGQDEEEPNKESLDLGLL
jgi:hypothetical protein